MTDVSPASIDLEREDLTKLITWDELFYSLRTHASPHGKAVVKAMAARPVYEPFLFDLGLLPTPYQDEALPALFGRSGAFGEKRMPTT